VDPFLEQDTKRYGFAWWVGVEVVGQPIIILQELEAIPPLYLELE